MVANALTAYLANPTINLSTVFYSAAVFSLVYFVYYLYQNRAKVPPNIPAHPLRPFFGHFLDSLPHVNKDMLTYIEEHGFQKLGSTFAVAQPFLPAFVMTTHPANIEHVLKTNFNNYIKGPIFAENLRELLGAGIFNVDGAEWHTQRRTASHMFTMRQLKDHMGKVFVEHALDVIKQLEAVKEGEFIDMQKVFLNFTFQTICNIAFSLHNVDEKEASEFLAAFDRASAICERRFFDASFKLKRAVAKVAPFLSPEEAKVLRDIKTINKFAYKVVRQRREEIAAGDLSDKGDLLSLFLSKTDTNDKPYSDEYLRDVILNFLIAGRDTTANLLSWCVYSLSQNPDVEATLQSNVDSYLRANCSDPSAPSEEVWITAKDITYVHAVLYETLRIFPSVAKDPKTAVADDVLPSGHKIPAGTQVVYCSYSQGRREELWPKPLEFNPTRFIELDSNNDAKIKEYSPFQFSAFQAGPRLCLGKNVAIMEASTMLAMIVNKFQLKLKPGVEVTYFDSLTLPMKNPLLMSVHRRK
jgi:cytochrome P450